MLVVLRNYLLTAGPTPVPERIALAMAQPMLYHRSQAFYDVLGEAQAGLKWIFQTSEPVMILAGTGTAGMEASIVNFFSPGDRVLCVRAGRFGERWSKMCETFQLAPINVDYEWGQVANPGDVEAVLERERGVRAVFLTASESSTGVAHPIRELAQLCAKRETLCIVDAVSALGAFDLPMDAWGIDVLVAASQKALMLPPGLAMVGVSKKAWAQNERATLPRFYLDLAKERKNQATSAGTAYTPAVSLVLGLRESLRMLREEGLEKIFARHAMLAEATRAGARAMSCELFSAGSPSPSVTAIKVPGNISGSELVQKLRTEFGVTISGGQEHLKGKIFRISHMGYLGPLDIFTALTAVELVLKSLGHTVDLGSAPRAAEEVIASRSHAN